MSLVQLFASLPTAMVQSELVMSILRRLAKSCIVSLLGKERKPRKILRGVSSGYRMFVSPAENLGYLLGMDEPHLQRAIRKYVGTGDTVFDVGANVGYVSLSLARQVGHAGSVIAFEPVPQNIESFRRNVELNSLQNVRLIAAAASDHSGEVIIRIPENLSTASLVWHRNDPSAVELSIRAVVIDELVEAGELGLPRFVKIDVEGAEAYALQGMRRTLAAAKPVLFIECSEAGRTIAWKILQELGYQCHSATTGKRIDSFGDYRHADFLWLPATG